ncbi:flagellar basal body-associated protein FliL [Entomohabitans teleogrylli]|uniref:flagellar basal body-associated protein FliL n=1 Tax=Entomohabitans teleogrylli TaxID=1384589 RepID=UPI00073D620B|nr:flagellar basal body-associated protein FliL [Entomohabitans teleogrylli]
MPKRNQNTPSGGNRNVFIIPLLLLVALSACATAGYTLYEMNNIKQHGNVSQQNIPPAPPINPIYMPLDTFTVSLKPTEQEIDRVLYIGLTLRVADNEAKNVLDSFLPEVRSRLLILFSKQTAEELSTDEGKYRLVDKIKEVVNQPFSTSQRITVTDVLFNAFILR